MIEIVDSGEVEVSSLNQLQRLLMVTDGTVTDILEAYFNEAIELVKIDESKVKYQAIDLDYSGDVLNRKILLKGSRSHRNFIYAESVIFLANLDESFAKDLQQSKTPIGKLWAQHRVETFKEVVDVRVEPLGELAQHFNLIAESKCLSRTYHVYSDKKLVMAITEKFPQNLGAA